MLTEIEKVLPSEIEKRSFEIIAEELGDKQLIPGTESIVKRCIHSVYCDRYTNGKSGDQ